LPDTYEALTQRFVDDVKARFYCDLLDCRDVADLIFQHSLDGPRPYSIVKGLNAANKAHEARTGDLNTNSDPEEKPSKKQRDDAFIPSCNLF